MYLESHTTQLAELKTWKCPKKAASDPPGLLHATMTEVGRHGIFLFGGQSKRVTNAVHKCDPSTVTWSIVDTAGVRAHISTAVALHSIRLHSPIATTAGCESMSETKVVLMKRNGFPSAHTLKIMKVQ